MLSEQSLSFAFFSSVIYFTKALLCLNVRSFKGRCSSIIWQWHWRWILLFSLIEWPYSDDSARRRDMAARIGLDRSTRSRPKRFDMHEDSGHLSELDNERLRQMESVSVTPPTSSCSWSFSLLLRDKSQTPLDILPTYVNLATTVLGPEYVSIYVKYCYLDTLLLLIQTFLECTPGVLHRLASDWMCNKSALLCRHRSTAVWINTLRQCANKLTRFYRLLQWDRRYSPVDHSSIQMCCESQCHSFELIGRLNALPF